MGETNELDTSGAGLYTDAEGNALDSMLIVGEKPWHYTRNQKLITLVERGTKVPLEKLNEAAGLDWEAVSLPEQEWLISLGVKPVVANQVVLPTKWVNVRTDSGLKIGNVSKGYHVFQNAEAPRFMMDLVDSGDLEVETAFSMYGGSRVIWTFKVPDDILIGGDKQEAVNTFLMLMNSHDGSVSITLVVTPVRVLCQNTMNWALHTAQRMTKIRHTKNAPIKFAEARRALEVGFAYTEELKEIGDKMSNLSFSDSEFEQFLQDIKPVPEPNLVNGKQTNAPAITMAKKVHEQIENIYSKHPTQLRINGTLWGAVQAVQFYSDHVVTAKSSPEARLSTVLRGKGLGPVAFARARELVK